ncbi:hypothetical protein [Paenibacillus sp. y28]|uniref:hypothetical protein n=1 Tax=Paenibacillus sp. y28 TaxID=3129110 RepID=UPI003016821D
MEQWLAFAQSQWYWVIIALVVILIVIKIVKTVVKWVIVLAVLAGLVYYGSSYVDDLKSAAVAVVGQQGDLRDMALKAFAGEDASFKQNADGTFTMTKSGISLEGKAGSNDVKISFKGQSITIKADEALNKIIEQAQKNQQ